MSPAERNIYILENTDEEMVDLQNVEVKDPFLIPCHGTIETKSPECYFT